MSFIQFISEPCKATLSQQVKAIKSKYARYFAIWYIRMYCATVKVKHQLSLIRELALTRLDLS